MQDATVLKPVTAEAVWRALAWVVASEDTAPGQADGAFAARIVTAPRPLPRAGAPVAAAASLSCDPGQQRAASVAAAAAQKEQLGGPIDTERAPPTAISQLRVLVVDDVPLNLRVATALLRKCGVEVAAQAVNGEEALAAAVAEPFDFIFMARQASPSWLGPLFVQPAVIFQCVFPRRCEEEEDPDAR